MGGRGRGECGGSARERRRKKSARKEERKNGESNELPATRLAGRGAIAIQPYGSTVVALHPRAHHRDIGVDARTLFLSLSSFLSLSRSRSLSHFDPLDPYSSSLSPLFLSLSPTTLFPHLAIGLPRRFKRRPGTYDVIGYRISAGSPIGRSPRTVAAPARQLRLICYVKTSIASIPSLVPPSAARPLAQPPSTPPYSARSPPTSPGHPFDGPRHTATAPKRVPLAIEEGTE